MEHDRAPGVPEQKNVPHEIKGNERTQACACQSRVP
jgi:hypothetical protein